MWKRSWQVEIDQRSHEAQVAVVAQHTRSCNRVPCAECGLPAHVYLESREAGIGSFRCRKCSGPSIAHLRRGGVAVIVEPIREMPLDLFNEIRYQGRVNQLVEQDDARRDRVARGEGLLMVEELALLNIAYDRGESAESFAERILGGKFFLATAGAQ